MTAKTLQDLFIHELSDIYSAEKQLTKGLPKLARAAQDPGLAEAFTHHLEETRGQSNASTALSKRATCASSASSAPPWKAWSRKAAT